MKVLRLGTVDEAVQAWAFFLRGQGYYWLEATTTFTDELFECTKSWQDAEGIGVDGEVGPKTYGQAQLHGFDPGFQDDSTEEDGPNWPPRPAFSAINTGDKIKLFGQFAFKPAGNPKNPEAIIITDGWDKKNIVHVDIPVLDAMWPKLGDDRFAFHTRCTQQIQDFFKAVDDAGLANRVLTWGGSWAPRFIRGSRTYLSNHAYGTAFDINVPWNGLKCVPARKGKTGSVRELVPIAHQFGLYWGGHFSRQDGMHFEVAFIL